MANKKEPYNCPTCFKQYKRRQHLQRHCSSHTACRPHRCAQCCKTFQRADVLRRHARTCEARAAAGLAAPHSRRRACDHCVHQKKACTLTQPCRNCENLSVPCHYSFVADVETSRGNAPTATASVGTESESESETTKTLSVPAVDGDPGWVNLDDISFDDVDLDILGSSTASWLDFSNLTSIITPNEESRADAQHARRESYPLHFLNNFTSQTGLINSFDCATLALREQVVASFYQGQGGDCGSQQSTASDDAHFIPDPLAARTKHDVRPRNISISAPTIYISWLHDPLVVKIHDITARAKQLVTAKPSNSAIELEWSLALERKCLEFFSPTNVRKFLTLYWAAWHPNINMVHRPTFDPIDSKSILLASMALIGACISPDLADRENAKLWFDTVEEMVFSDVDLCAEPVDAKSCTPALQRRKIQALQAAYMVCILQNWEGTDSSKRRIRRYRFSTVLSVVRDHGIPSAKHRNYKQGIESCFNWRDFAMRDELIRTFLWTYLLDHAFVIFNNYPPRTVIKEMNMHMAWPEACFQATTADECLEEIKKRTASSAAIVNITLREVVEMICKGGMSTDMHRSLADLGPLNMFAIVVAFHSLIFQQQNSFGGDGQLLAIRNALGNWKAIWDIYSAEFSWRRPHATIAQDDLTPTNAWKRIGFMRYASEFWQLASIIVDRLAGVDVQEQSEWSPSHLNSGNQILSKYDETSMRQVNDLITEFQKVQIHH